MLETSARPRRLIWLWLATSLVVLIGLAACGLIQARTPAPTPVPATPTSVEPGLVQAGQAALQAEQWAQAATAFDQALAVQPPEARQHVLDATLGRALARYHLAQYPAALEDFAAVQQLDATRPEPYHYRTEILWAQGDLDGALAAGQEALAHEPNFGLPYALQALRAFQKHDDAAALTAASAAIERDANLGLAYRVRGSVYAWQYDFDHAWDDLSAAVVKTPTDAEAMAMQVYVALEREDRASAEKDAALAAQAAPQTPAALWAQAQVRLYQYDSEGAKSLIDQAIALDGNRPEFFLLQGRTYTLTADAPLALASFQKALSLRADFFPAISGVAFWHASQWDFATTLADGQRLVALNPRAPDGYILLADEHDRTHHLDAELKDVQQLLAAYPNRSWGYIYRGNYYLSQHDYPHAQADFEQAVKLDPLSGNGLIGLAFVAMRQSQFDVARQDMDQLLKFDPASRGALVTRSLAELQQGQEAEAWQGIKAAFAVDPADPHVLVTRAELSTQDGDYSNALADLGRVLQAFPGYTFAYTVRARTYLADGKHDQAVQDGSLALRQDHDDPDGYLVLALAAASQKDWSGVLFHTNKVIELDATQTEAYLLRGQANIALGHYADAIADFRQKIKLDPKVYDGYANLAAALYATGDIEGARANVQQALTLTKDVNITSGLETDLAFYISIPPLIGNLRTVKDLDNGYTLAYAPIWLQLRPTTNKAELLSLVPITGSTTTTFQVLTAGNLPGLTLQTWASDVDKAFAAGNPTYSSLSVKSARVGNLSGLVRQYQSTIKINGDDLAVTGRQFLAVAHGQAWLINYQALTANFSQYEALVEAMVASFSTT